MSYVLTSNCACLGSYLNLIEAMKAAEYYYHNYGICQNGRIGAYIDGKFENILNYEFEVKNEGSRTFLDGRISEFF